MLNKLVSVFSSVNDVKNPKQVELYKIFHSIKDGGKTKDLILQIRQEPEKRVRDDLKLKLPAICFSGRFDERSNKGIVAHSGLVTLDYDHVENLPEFKAKVIKDKYTFACFLSPSGDGLKVIVKIPPEPQNHGRFCDALSIYYKEKSWDSLRDVSRCCYFSYDPDIYINESSELFDIMVHDAPKSEYRKPRIKVLTDHSVIYEKLKIWVEKNQEYVDGNKYKFLVALASACNRFGIPQESAANYLIVDYQNKSSFVKSEDFERIVERIYISYVNQFGQSYFDMTGEMNDFDPSSSAKDIIYVDDIREEMLQSYEHGDAKGTTTYFTTIDPHFTWKKGEISLFHGIGNHGKTQLMLQLALIKSVKEGTKWGIFSPEQHPPIDFYKDLIHTYIGKSTEKGWENYMSKSEFIEGMDFIKEYFFFIYPKDDSPTPEYINERFEELIIKHNIQGCITDPFNQLDNDFGKHGRDDLYISTFLSAEKRFALEHDVYKIIIAHPKGTLQKDKEGNYQCPDVYDLAGGAMWNNKMDDIGAIYRPFHGVDKSNPYVEFRVQKIKKQKLVGVPGDVPLYFDVKTNRYLEFKEFVKRDYENKLYHRKDSDPEGDNIKFTYSPFEYGYQIERQQVVDRMNRNTQSDKADYANDDQRAAEANKNAQKIAEELMAKKDTVNILLAARESQEQSSELNNESTVDVPTTSSSIETVINDVDNYKKDVAEPEPEKNVAEPKIEPEKNKEQDFQEMLKDVPEIEGFDSMRQGGF